jgi:hypothetical protein
MDFWKPPKDEEDFIAQIRILPKPKRTSVSSHFITLDEKTLKKSPHLAGYAKMFEQPCKAPLPKDYRIDFLQAVHNNPCLKGEARYDMEEKYGPHVVMDCAFKEGECLIMLGGRGTHRDDFFWVLTKKGRDMLNEYNKRAREYNERIYKHPESKCPFCELLAERATKRGNR